MNDKYLTMEQRDLLLSTLANAETLLKQIKASSGGLASPLLIILEEQLKEADEILMNIKVD